MGIFLLIAGYLLTLVNGDCYLHTFRGSNNRLNEQSANRNNGNRLFDSQNNNRGGYNVGDLSDTAYNAGSTTTNPTGPWANALDEGQYSMMFFENSDFQVEWTNQHGCGGNEATDANKLNCNLVFQYGCQTITDGALSSVYQMQLNLKNGRNTNTPDTTNSMANAKTQHTTNDGNGRGRHENEAYYYACTKTPRNKGLFLADQNVKGSSAQYTRQNPNGNRRGLECPEERDYYPYWNPSPFMDLAILTDNVEDCDARFNFKGESQNVKPKGMCVEDIAPTAAQGGDNDKCFMYVHNDTKCNEQAECKWQTFVHNIAAPRCEQAPWTRANSLGNGRTGMPTTLNITTPYLTAAGLGQYTDIKTDAAGNKIAKCILRIRYNISTDDYDPANTNASHNENLNNKVNGQPAPIVSPVEQNPTVNVGLRSLQGLRLAINTNQFGRTFQDRSHVFYLMSRDNLPAAVKNAKIQNFIVRGKRGNIVQTFPAVEYDFSPKRFEVAQTDLIHMQWTGSNTHNNGNPAGDGQAGDAGEGTHGTDRHNLVAMVGSGGNYPVPFKTPNTQLQAQFDTANFFKHTNCWVPSTTTTGETNTDNVNFANQGYVPPTGGPSSDLCAVRAASGGYYKETAELTTKAALSVLLNNAPASLPKGMLFMGQAAGTYELMCTRNNNFSNRSQKAAITVK